MAIDEPTVIFRCVPDFPHYRVGDDGSVWSKKPRGWRRLAPGSSGPYELLWLWRDGKRFHHKTHVLVLEVFVGPRPAGMACCHNDGDPTNNRLSNLRWDTYTANSADKARHGTDPIGERNPRAIIDADAVSAIRSRYRHGDTPRLAAEYGVSVSTIRDIVKGRSWKHVA